MRPDDDAAREAPDDPTTRLFDGARSPNADVCLPSFLETCRFFDAGKNGDGIPEAEVEEEDAEAAAAAAAEAAAEAKAAAATTPEDWRGWVAGAMALDSFKIKKTSKKGNTRQVDLRPQLLGLEYMDQTAVDAALKGKHIPIPPTPRISWTSY